MSSNSVTSTAREHVFPLFVKYVSANVLGMIGYSCYILADTFFVARGIGSDAIAALNLVLPADDRYGCCCAILAFLRQS